MTFSMRRYIKLVENTVDVASEGGAPGLWFHGTPYAFDAFDVDAGEFDSSHETPAIFLTDDPKLAEAYASREREPMGQGLAWSDFKQHFVEPAARIIAASSSPSARIMSRWAEKVMNGDYDFDMVCNELPDVAEELRSLKNRHDSHMAEASMTKGANIRPCRVSGRFMHMHFVDDFHAGLYDLAMRQAREAGLDGVLFHDVVDTPTGHGPPADILAVFDGHNVHPGFGTTRSA